MTNIIIVARKEIQEGLRNRWVLAMTLLLAALALALSFLGSAPTGNVGVNRLDVVIVSLSSLTIFLIPLIALLISHDAIVGESERGTLMLLLSYPVSRPEIIFGKFIGHVGILAFATLIGYGVAAAALLATGTAIETESWAAFLSLIGSSVLLGAVFIAIGYVISTLVDERGTAAGIAIGVWLVLVLIYDMTLLGILVALQGQALPGGLLDLLLVLNPTDVYRLLNLSSGSAATLSGMGGVAANSALDTRILVLALALWTAVPLIVATMAFSRRER